jgi:hypothetical protein
MLKTASENCDTNSTGLHRIMMFGSRRALFQSLSLLIKAIRIIAAQAIKWG